MQNSSLGGGGGGGGEGEEVFGTCLVEQRKFN